MIRVFRPLSDRSETAPPARRDVRIGRVNPSSLIEKHFVFPPNLYAVAVIQFTQIVGSYQFAQQ